MTPGWSPPWDDVDFDHGAAARAAGACRRRAADLERVVAELRGVRARTRAHWRGGHADDHDRRTGDELAEALRLRDELLALARRIERGAEAARAEQVARERARARWRAERDARFLAGS